MKLFRHKTADAPTSPYALEFSNTPPAADGWYVQLGGGFGNLRDDEAERRRVEALEARLREQRESEAAHAVTDAERYRPRQIQAANLP